SAMRFSSVIGVGSEDDPPLLGELAADATEELVPVDPARGDLLARRFHHPASLLVEGPFLLCFRFQRPEDGLPHPVGRLLAEELAPCQPPRGLARDEVLLDVRQAHASPARMLTGCHPVNTLRTVNWDDAAVLRWLEPLVSRKGDIAEVFAERLRETALEW